MPQTRARPQPKEPSTLTRDCLVCGQNQPKDRFSKSQWSKGIHRSRCLSCVTTSVPHCIAITFLVRDYHGHENDVTLSLRVDPRDAVSLIKHQILQALDSNPRDDLRLIFNRKELCSWKSLNDYNIRTNGCVLYVVKQQGKIFCKNCKERLPRDNFSKKELSTGGLNCKRCERRGIFLRNGGIYPFPFDCYESPQHRFPFRFEDSLEGKDFAGSYRIIFLQHNGQYYSSLVKGEVTVHSKKYKHIEGNIHVDSLRSFIDEINFSFNNYFPAISHDFVPMSDHFPGNGVDVHIHDEDIESGAEISTRWGCMFVFSERGAILREDLCKNYRNTTLNINSDISLEEGENLMKCYRSPDTSKLWLHHLPVPDIAILLIHEFFRAEPPPVLFFEKGDLMIGCSVGERDDDRELFLVARPKLEQKDK